jgi:hypothetical protein
MPASALFPPSVGTGSYHPETSHMKGNLPR